MSVVEAIVPIVANPTYSIVYEHTFDTEYFAGAVFLVTLGCMIICILAFMYVIYYLMTQLQLFHIEILYSHTNFRVLTIDHKRTYRKSKIEAHSGSINNLRTQVTTI